MICPICRDRPLKRVREHKRWTVTCGTPSCRYARNKLGPALAARQRLYDERMQAVVAFHFGSLSLRERQLFRHVWGVAWKRGYEKGKHSQGRRSRSQEAA